MSSSTLITEDTYQDMAKDACDGFLVPIVSSALLRDAIFDPDRNQQIGVDDSDSDYIEYLQQLQQAESLSIPELLAVHWGRDIGYPMRNNLARMERVADFGILATGGIRRAKQDYIDYLKRLLFEIVQDRDLDDPNELNHLITAVGPSLNSNVSFSALVAELELPQPEKKSRQAKDGNSSVAAFDLLARLDLPIYLTTSPFFFLEDALMRQNPRKRPRSEILPWHSRLRRHLTTMHNSEPTKYEPVVFHIYGHELIPESLVMTTEDHLELLMTLVRDYATTKDLAQKAMPQYLSTALAEGSQLFLGFRPQDWEFQILAQCLLANTDQNTQTRQKDLQITAVMQIEPEKDKTVSIIDPISTRDYLERYFERADMKVGFGPWQSCLVKLWEQVVVERKNMDSGSAQ